MPLKKVLELTRPLGLEAIEVGTGNYPGDPHAPLQELLKSKPKRDELLALVKSEGLIISALSCHGNCLHPDENFAKKSQQVQTDTIKLAELMGIKTVIDSRLPGSTRRETAFLGYLPMAPGNTSNPRMAMVQESHPLLVQTSQVRQGARRPGRVRNAPRFRGL